MNQRDSIFLSSAEAVKAVCRDLRRYDPQIILCCQIIRLVTSGRVIAKGESQKDGAWINVQGRQNMRWMVGPELVAYVCAEIERADLDLQLVSKICARVFHTRAWIDRDPKAGQEGVRIETGMEDFLCQQCGQCCRSLDYHKELTTEDVVRWERLGRNDILKWVRRVDGQAGRVSGYRIWTVPGTTQLAEVCPFLRKIPSQNRWACLIHDVKPGICRQYPLSRKHAIMTGCPGFNV